MSRDYHSTELIGRLAADPVITYTQNNGTPIARLKVLVNEQWKDQGGKDQKHVESYAVITFNGQAEGCGNYLSTGRTSSFGDETVRGVMKRMESSDG